MRRFLFALSGPAAASRNPLGCLLGIGLLAWPLAPLHAETFTVINTADRGVGSLHEAIIQANAQPGPDEIVFNIPGGGIQKIDIQHNGLPEITDPVTIDGYSQPGASPNAKEVGNNARILIQIDGADNFRGPVNGIAISAGRSVLRGVSITGIPARIYFGLPEDPPPPHPEGDAILLKTNGGNVIEGNFVGVAPNGEPVRYGAYIGVEVLSSSNRIGGASAASRNVIARHETGIVARGENTVVQGNYIGTDIFGNVRAGGVGGGSGLGASISGSNFLIGGTAPGAGNVISGNDRGGIIIDSAATDGAVQGNLVGRAADGLTILENGFRPDVLIHGSRNLIGGLEVGAANAFGAGSEAVRIRQANAGTPAGGNAILSNLYFRPGNGKIRLGAAGNDLGDSDSGPNNLQNYPIVTTVRRTENSTSVSGGLNSTPSMTFLLQFYVNPQTADFGRFLGTETVTTDSSGTCRFDFTFPVQIPERDFIAATATDQDGNTSEFSHPFGRVQLANISTRGLAGTDDEVLIAGFIVRRTLGEGNPPRFRRKVLIRALGPSLNVGGRPIDGLLANPYLELYDSNGVSIAANDDWRRNQQQEIAETGITPPSDAEAAIVVVLPDGNYTAHVRGADGSSGLALIEVFSLPLADATSELVNISTRGLVGTGDNVLIGGIIINGDAAQPVLIRALGPGLASAGLRGPLHDPILEFYDGSGNLLAANDNWRADQESEIAETGLAPNDERDSAIKTTLIPGGYTAIVRGKGGATGNALLEFYDLRN